MGSRARSRWDAPCTGVNGNGKGWGWSGSNGLPILKLHHKTIAFFLEEQAKKISECSALPSRSKLGRFLRNATPSLPACAGEGGRGRSGTREPTSVAHTAIAWGEADGRWG